MDAPGDLDNLTIFLALVVSFCVFLTVIFFLLWLRRQNKQGLSSMGRRKKPARQLQKKRTR